MAKQKARQAKDKAKAGATAAFTKVTSAFSINNDHQTNNDVNDDENNELLVEQPTTVEDHSSSDDEGPEKSSWLKRQNEIDELKKIFFEFLMKWQK